MISYRRFLTVMAGMALVVCGGILLSRPRFQGMGIGMDRVKGAIELIYVSGSR